MLSLSTPIEPECYFQQSFLISCHIGITDVAGRALYEACKTLPDLEEDRAQFNSIPSLKALPRPIYGLKLE